MNLSTRRPRLDARVGSTRLSFGATWLVVLPLMVWGVRTIFVPLLGPSLGNWSAWAAAVAIVAGSVIGLAAHGAGHIIAAHALRAEIPPRVPIYPLGDAAQVWPAGAGAARDGVISAAGILASLIAAVVAAGVWWADLGTFAHVVSYALLWIHAGAAVINLAPGFPFDGGRLVRALAFASGISPTAGTRLAHRIGLALLLGLMAWAGLLAWQQARFSTVTSAATLVFAVLAALALFAQPSWRAGGPALARGGGRAAARRTRIASAVLITIATVALTATSALVLPTNAGIEAPGSAQSIEPLVHVPADRAQPVAGTLMLTTVFEHAPIVVGEWLYARLDRATRLAAAHELVPPGISPQQLAAIQLRDLETSEKVAIVVGLQLAGFDASLRFEGTEISAIDPASRAADLLRVGDSIETVNGEAVASVLDLRRILGADPHAATARLGLRRVGQALSLDVPLTPPASADAVPTIGILVPWTIGPLSLPFPVTITALQRSLRGGPSAGLMFALAVYNAVTPADITAGHRIAGTGTLDPDGNVGTIAGVQQKVVAAERAGARYFLVPPENYADARAIARRVDVVRVATVQAALAFLQGLPPLTR